MCVCMCGIFIVVFVCMLTLDLCKGFLGAQFLFYSLPLIFYESIIFLLLLLLLITFIVNDFEHPTVVIFITSFSEVPR